MNSQNKPGDKEAARRNDEAAEALEGDASLETVRDILFGQQIRETRSKSKELEKLIRQLVSELEKKINAELKDLRKAMDTMHKDLEKAAVKTAVEVSKEFEATRESIEDLDKASRAARQELYDTLDTARIALEADAKAWNESLGKELDATRAKLEDDKADRRVLGKLLMEVGEQLAESGTDR